MDLSTTLTIPSGGTTSNVLDFGDPASREDVMVLLLAPGTLDALTFSVEVAEKPGGTFRTLRSGGTDVTLAAGKADPITIHPATPLRILASGAVAAARVFDALWVPRRG